MKRTELYKLLQSAGLHSQYLGYEYFADAVWLAAKDPARLHNMRRDIYLPVAALHQVSCSSVERDIRTIRHHQGEEVRGELQGERGHEHRRKGDATP